MIVKERNARSTPEEPAVHQPSAMRNVRRAYVYAVAAATLLITAIGGVLLLGLGLDQLFTAISGAEWFRGGGDWERQRLSISVPLIVIAAPIWWLHWRMARRAMEGPDADSERHSWARNLYFAVVFLMSGLWVAMNVVSTIQLSLARAFGGDLDHLQRGSIITGTSIFAVAVIVWTFHLLTFVHDVSAVATEQRSDLPVQISLYVTCAIGGPAALFGVSNLIHLGLRAALNDNGAGRWWRDPLSEAAATAVTFGALWAVNWVCAQRLTSTSAGWGNGRYGATVRRLYLIAIPLMTGTVALIYFAQGIEALTRFALGLPPQVGDARAFTILSPLLSAVPFALWWIIHRQLFLREPDRVGDPILPVTIERLFDYVMAALGLFGSSAGTALLVAALVKRVAGIGNWRAEIGWPLGLMIGGGALWIWYWQRTRARFAREREVEQTSTIRRVYLFVILGASLVALVVGLAMTIYQMLQKLLDVVGSGSLAGGIALPLGITAATAVGAAYHLVLLRRDLPVRGLTEREEQGEGTHVELVLTGPAGADLNDMVAFLRQGLPAGYAIERHSVDDGPTREPVADQPVIDRPVHA